MAKQVKLKQEPKQIKVTEERSQYIIEEERLKSDNPERSNTSEDNRTPLEKIVEGEEGIKANMDGTEEEVNEKLWNDFVKKISLGDILEDQMLRAFKEYEKHHRKVNNEEVAFKMKLERKKAPKVPGLFAQVILTLYLERPGRVVKIQSKQITFKHIKEAREGYAWKAALQEAMLHSVIDFACQFIIIQDDVRSGRVKATPTT